MSDGGVGNWLSFWATFKIQGGPNGLTTEELKNVVTQIKTILAGTTLNQKPVVGQIVSVARLSDNVGDEGIKPALKVSYGENQ